MRAALVFALVGMVVMQTSPADADTADPLPSASGDAASRYVAAVRTMQALPQPAFITFSSNFIGEKTGFQIDRDKDDVSFAVTLGGGSPGPIATTYRNSDRVAVLALKDGPAQTHSPLLDPTWSGAAAFAHFGLHPPQTPSTTPAPAASNPPAAAGDVRTIGSVSVFSVAFYRVSDSGTATCPGGSAGESLHLIAYSDTHAHPLTDVIIEDATQRICSMTFKLHTNGPIAYSPIVQLHFAAVGNYYLTTEGFIDGEVHLFGLGMKHTHVRIARTALFFPVTLPAQAFTDK